jgi:hypothetical protein
VTPAAAWHRDFSRYPVLTGARTTIFRAYEFVESSPLTLSPGDAELEEAVWRHGHGGRLARWEFRYVGVREIRYGDLVKFVAVITEPPSGEPSLIRVVRGPERRVPRLQVLLIRRDFKVEVFATTTVFTGKDFRRTDLDRVADSEMPIRVYAGDYSPLSKRWRTEREAKVLKELFSPLAGSLGAKIDRYRFRVAWFQADPAERPPLSRRLLARDVSRPLAATGSASATEEEVLEHWGSLEGCRRRLGELCGLALRGLARLGVEPGAEFYVEWDSVGDLGSSGIGLRTFRYRIRAPFLAWLVAQSGA